VSATISARPPALPAIAGEVVLSLYQHRLLCARQVREMHLPHTSLRYCQQLLSALERHRLITSVRSGRGSRKLYFLTAAGAEAAEQIPTRVETRRKLITPAQALGPLRAHTLAVNDTGICFLHAAREREGDECGPFAWRHELAHPIGRPPGLRRAELLITDALIRYLLAEPDGQLSFHYRFLELDRATIPADELQAKLSRYRRLHDHIPDGERQPSWRAEYPLFPQVICVLTGQPRLRLERRLATVIGLCQQDPALPPQGPVQISFSLLEDLKDAGPFAPVFLRHHDPERLVDWLGHRSGPRAAVEARS
jgi:hypothetical protein